MMGDEERGGRRVSSLMLMLLYDTRSYREIRQQTADTHSQTGNTVSDG